MTYTIDIEGRHPISVEALPSGEFHVLTPGCEWMAETYRDEILENLKEEESW